MRHQDNQRGEKKHHDPIRDMIAASSYMLFFNLNREVPNGYIAFGSLLFLQEQIKDIIIRDTHSKEDTTEIVY